MIRRTITLPETIDAAVRETSGEGESFSAAVTRLIEVGVLRSRGISKRPRYIASGEGPDDLGRRAEQYLGELATSE
jgi:hypothetical protein